MKQQIYHSIEIGLHSKCNLHCPLCTRSKKFFLDNKDHRKFNNELDFEESATKIISHVKEGMLIAKKYNLPSILSSVGFVLSS